VVVALDTDGDGDAVTGIEHPRSFPRSDEHVFAFCRQAAQMDLG